MQRHVEAPSARAPLTSTMAVADSMGDYRQALGLQRAYSASQRLILSTGVRLRTSWKPSAMLQWSGVGLWVSLNGSNNRSWMRAYACSRATARQPISRRQKPPSQSIASTASCASTPLHQTPRQGRVILFHQRQHNVVVSVDPHRTSPHVGREGA